MTGADVAHAAGRKEGWDAALGAVAAELRLVAPAYKVDHGAYTWAWKAVERVLAGGLPPGGSPPPGGERDQALDEVLMELQEAPPAERLPGEHRRRAAEAVARVRARKPAEARAAAQRSRRYRPAGEGGFPPPYQEPAPGQTVLLAVIRMEDAFGNAMRLSVRRGANAALSLGLAGASGAPLGLASIMRRSAARPSFCEATDAATVDAAERWAREECTARVLGVERGPSAR